jgi:hypothetical protein
MSLERLGQEAKPGSENKNWELVKQGFVHVYSELRILQIPGRSLLPLRQCYVIRLKGLFCLKQQQQNTHLTFLIKVTNNLTSVWLDLGK